MRFFNSKVTKTLNKNKKENELDKAMPCNKCDIKDICKHAFSIKDFPYNKDLFTIEVSCKRFIDKAKK